MQNLLDFVTKGFVVYTNFIDKVGSIHNLINRNKISVIKLIVVTIRLKKLKEFIYFKLCHQYLKILFLPKASLLKK